jgi:hypothetical protein
VAVNQPSTTHRSVHDGIADPWAVRVALLIGIVSIVSALGAWRASVASNEATAAQVRAMQSIAQRLQLEQRIEALVDQDERLIGRYQEHLLAAREIQAAADTTRATDPDLADALDLEAQGRLALARQLERFFLAAVPTESEEGALEYDAAFVARNLRESTTELRELQPQRFLDVADIAGARATGLVAMVLILVAALFFLTLAQLTRHSARLGVIAIGGLAAFVGTAGFVVLEILLRTG